MEENFIYIAEDTAKAIIYNQFPDFSGVAIRKNSIQGHDHTVFRIGKKHIAAFPNAKKYGERIQQLSQFLSQIKLKISIQISEILKIGAPAHGYPFLWSISTFIEGESANLCFEAIDLNKFTIDLSTVLNEFKMISMETVSLFPGKENWYRGGDLAEYNHQVIEAFGILKNTINYEILYKIWLKALGSSWQLKPIFVHGDIALGNLIVKDKKLCGIIDFGTMCVGDPACDLMIAFTVFSQENRKIFKKELDYDRNTWYRAMGLTLWKALIEYAELSKSCARDWQEPAKVIDEIINEYNITQNG